MWPNHGFSSNSDFANNFNQDDYPPSPIGGGATGQGYFPQQLPFSPNGGFMSNEFQPEVGLYNPNNPNEGAFAQNHFLNAANSQFSPPQFSSSATTTPTSRPMHLNPTAAQLKAKLLAKRSEQAASATPSVGMVAKCGPAEDSGSLRQSPRTPITTAESSDQELNITELISQYAGPQPAEDTEMKDARVNLQTQPQRPLSRHESSAKSQGPLSGSPTKVIKPSNSKGNGNNSHNRNVGNEHASSGSMSEGEIMEDGTIPKATQSAESRSPKALVKPTSKSQSVACSTRNEPPKTALGRGPRELSRPRRALPNNERQQAPRRFTEIETRPSSSTYRPDYIFERKARSTEELPTQSYRSIRDQTEDTRRPEIKTEKREENSRSVREAKQPTLAELLPHDEDLREWLEITDYHNEPYRDKILNRRRAIAALDAQKNAILAEMEAEERGGGLPTASSTMLPPPIPNRAGDRFDSSSKPANEALETQRDRVIPNKRSHSDSQDPADGMNVKIARTNDRGPRFKQEDDANHGGSRYNGYDPARHRSSDDRREDRDFLPHEGRGRDRATSRDRDVSPSRIAFENRPPARTRPFEKSDDYYSRDRDDWDDRERERGGGGDKRPFVVSGGYRGRAFDPNYRGRGGRGGGRGRGDHQNLELRAEVGSFGAKIANGKPFKDEDGFQIGGEGGS